MLCRPTRHTQECLNWPAVVGEIMRVLLTKVLVSITVAVLAASAAATVSEAVVQIVVSTDGDKGGFGTGFFWSDRGQLITAYHVVVGARRIRVIDSSGRWYDKVTVTHIQPGADLALLQVHGLSGATAFIPFDSMSPMVTDELRSIGNPRGVAQQTFVGRVTSERLVPSDQFRDAKGRMIFRADAQPLDLLPLDITIYNGMSGAPVLLAGKAIAVLVASLNEGGAMAWGIPVKYISGSKWTPVNRAVEDVSWPSFSLLSDGARSLEVLVSYAAADGALLDTYLSQSKKLEDLMSATINQYSQCMVTMDSWQKLQLTGEAKMALADPLQADIEDCIRVLISLLVEVAAIEDRLAVTHAQISAAVRKRKDDNAPPTSVVQIGLPLPSPINADAMPVLNRLIASLNMLDVRNERSRVQLLTEAIESMHLDSDASLAYTGTMLHDIRMIAVYFNRLLLQ